jgi:hypothetical protein
VAPLLHLGLHGFFCTYAHTMSACEVPHCIMRHASKVLIQSILDQVIWVQVLLTALAAMEVGLLETH